MSDAFFSDTMGRIEGMFERFYERHPGSLYVPRRAAVLERFAAPDSDQRSYTPAFRARVIAAIRSGRLTYQQIATRYRLPFGTVNKWAGAAGLRHKNITAQAKASAIALAASGLTPAEIARRLSIHPNTINNWTRAAGYHFTRRRHTTAIATPRTSEDRAA